MENMPVRLNRALEAGAEERGGVVVRNVIAPGARAPQISSGWRCGWRCVIWPAPGGEVPLVLDDALVNF